MDLILKQPFQTKSNQCNENYGAADVQNRSIGDSRLLISVYASINSVTKCFCCVNLKVFMLPKPNQVFLLAKRNQVYVVHKPHYMHIIL